MNRLFLIGNLTRDPELSETSRGVSSCRFSIAVKRPYKSDGEQQQADFFNIITWRQQAENCGRYLKKGSKVAIEAYLQTRTYEDKDGNKRSTIDIIADHVEFLSSNNQSSQGSEGRAQEPAGENSKPRPKQIDLIRVDDEDLPF